jgi:hypothetical protein
MSQGFPKWALLTTAGSEEAEPALQTAIIEWTEQQAQQFSDLQCSGQGARVWPSGNLILEGDGARQRYSQTR